MKKLGIVLVVVIALGGFGALGYKGYRFYRVWKPQRLMEQAHRFLEESDSRNALLCLEQVLRSNPYHPEACRMMADLSEAAGMRTALLWRSRAAAVTKWGVSFTNRLLWAKTALAFGDLAQAKEALESIEPSRRENATYMKLAAALSAASGDIPKAIASYQAAVALEPDNPLTRLNLALLQVRHTNEAVAGEGLETLHALRADPAVRTEALRNLTALAVREKRFDQALELCGELLQETNTVFADHLVRLSILKEKGAAEFPSALSKVQQDSKDDPAKVLELGRWMIVNCAPQETLGWLSSLPPNLQTNAPLSILMADCYGALGDWAQLQKTTDPQDWGEFECLRLLYQTRALRAQGMDIAARSEWARALKATGGQLSRLTAMHRVLQSWRWLTEEEEVLWMIVNRYPSEKWAFRLLAARLHATGQTRALLSLYQRTVELEPDNLNARNNLASVALLLNALEVRPHELARAVHEADTTNGYYAATYAYSLHLQGKTDEAIKVLNTLSAEQLKIPAVAAYYGLILSAMGEKARAREFLDLSLQARLLPEERSLIERARVGAADQG